MVKVLKLHEDAQLPKSSHPGSALAWDIYACENAVVEYGKITKVRTGIAVQVEKIVGAGFLLRERSGMGKEGIKLLGGVIDSDYTGEWIIMLTRLTPEPYVISKGDRIAQAIMLPTLTAIPVEWTEKFTYNTDRGDSGFGASGK